jgi:LPS export ABC transporter protein LptC
MKTRNRGIFILVVQWVALMAIFVSCQENDIKQVNKITKVDNSPNMAAQGLKVDYTENGKLVYTMTSPEMQKYDQPEAKTIFPKGFNVVFYDSLQHQRGTARANYGLSHDATQILELKGNVIIVNYKDKTRIETEHMFWDRRNKTITGDLAVKIITADRVFTGIGFKSNEDLTQREVLHPTAEWWVKDF